MSDKELVERLRKYSDWFCNAGKVEVTSATCEELFDLLSEAATKIESMASDSDRLDFVLAKMAWIRQKKADSGSTTYWLETQDEDENFIRLSGAGFYNTPRAAIDQAISQEAGSHE